MQRLIDADALKESIDEHVYIVHHGFNETEYGCTQYGIHQIIDEQPTIDAEPVKHGKWRFVKCATGLRCQCSECLHWVDAGTDRNYCPNCGANMRGRLMSDLISRQDAICALLEKGQRSKRYKLGEIWELNFDEIREALATVPSAEPVRHGKWKWLSCTYDRVPKEKEYECSECHHKTIIHGDYMPWEKYCPNCGADMRGEE